MRRCPEFSHTHPFTSGRVAARTREEPNGSIVLRGNASAKSTGSVPGVMRGGVPPGWELLERARDRPRTSGLPPGARGD